MTWVLFGKKWHSGLIFAICLLTGAALAQSPVAVTIDTRVPGLAIPADFNGFSFETGSLRFNNKNYSSNAYFFDPTNSQLLTLFRNLGIKSLRIGGNSSDNFVPANSDIDTFFGFARILGLKVIYSLRLKNGDPVLDAATAQYVWQTYRTNIISLAIGNEANSYNGSDSQITNIASYIAKWQSFASNVVAAVPDVKLGGPDNGNGATAWASAFARAEQGSSNVVSVFSHYEPKGTGNKKTAQQLIDGMLSPTIDTTTYPACYNAIGAMARSRGFSYRFTEFNSNVAPISTEMRNHSFATALFALDALHWWAANGCLGIHFHTGFAGFNGGMFIDANGNYQVDPLYYGVAAFSVGGQGNVEAITITNTGRLNLTAYAVGNTTNVYVTVINKEHGAGARDAKVTLSPDGFRTANVAAMFLAVTNGDVTATNGVTLGGAALTGSRPWIGQWTTLGSLTNGQYVVTVPATSAAIVRIQAGILFAPPRIVRDLSADVPLMTGRSY